MLGILIYRLSRVTRLGFECIDLDLVSRLHRFIGILLSGRLMLTNASLSAQLE